MTSKRKIRANQENAKKSTGPRTSHGKQSSSQNAYKHGIWAKQLDISDDERADYEKLIADLGALLRPEGPILQYYFDEIVLCMWRLRRLIAFENTQSPVWDRVLLPAGNERADGATEQKDIPRPTTEGEFLHELEHKNQRELKYHLSALRELRELILLGQYLTSERANDLANHLGKDFIDKLTPYLPTGKEATATALARMLKAKFKDPEKALTELQKKKEAQQEEHQTSTNEGVDEQSLHDLLEPKTSQHREFLLEIINGRIDKTESQLKKAPNEKRRSAEDFISRVDLQLRYSSALKRDLRKAIDAYQSYLRLGRAKSK